MPRRYVPGPRFQDVMPRALVFALVGAAVLLGSLAWTGAAWWFGYTADQSPGVVVRLNAGGSHPEVLFMGADGQPVEYPQNGLVWGYRVGDRVTVLFDPARPRRAVVDAFGARYGFAVLGAVLGAVFLCVAAALWRRARSG